jgi:hypothetical protein
MELSPSWEAANCATTQEINPAFYGTRRFITVFTRALHRSLSWASPKLEDHPLSAVRACLFNIFAASLQNWRASPPSATWGRAMPWWQGTHLTCTEVGRICEFSWSGLGYDPFDNADVLSTFSLNCCELLIFSPTPQYENPINKLTFAVRKHQLKCADGSTARWDWQWVQCLNIIARNVKNTFRAEMRNINHTSLLLPSMRWSEKFSASISMILPSRRRPVNCCASWSPTHCCRLHKHQPSNRDRCSDIHYVGQWR